jgi:hypothetical protein
MKPPDLKAIVPIHIAARRDGYRMLAHHNSERVRLIWRRGLDWGEIASRSSSSPPRRLLCTPAS